MDWTPLLKTRDRLHPRPNISTPDLAVVAGECPKGHPVMHARELMDARDADHHAFEARLRGLQSSESGRMRCVRCGKRADAESLTFFYASFLPLQRVDLLAHVRSDGTFGRGIRHSGDDVRHALGPEPEELFAAQPARIAHLTLRGLLEGYDAEKLFAEAREAHHDYPPALAEMRSILFRRDEQTAALDGVMTALKSAPDWPHAWFALGDLLEDMDRVDEACQAYQRAVALDPAFVAAWVQLGNVHGRSQRLREMAKAYETALDVAPHDPHALVNVSIAFIQAGAASEAYGAVTRIRPSHARLHPAVGKAAGKVLQHLITSAGGEERWRDMESATTFRVLHDPEDAGSWLNRALALFHLRAYPDARAKALRAKELGLQDDTADRMISALAGRQGADAEAVIERDARRPVWWTDTMGRDCLAVDHPVDLETTHRFVWRPEHRPTLASDADLHRLLVAKGHNARFDEEESLSGKGFRIEASFSVGTLRPLGGEETEKPKPKDEGRKFVIVVQEEPDADFLRLAAAERWDTLDGRTVASGAVPVLLNRGDDDLKPLKATFSFGTPKVPRILAADEDAVSLERYVEETPLVSSTT